MKKLLVLLVAFVPAWASPTACLATAPLSFDVTAGYSCIDGDLQFSNFTYSKTGPGPSAEFVNVVPVTAPGDYGLEFDAAWHCNAYCTADAIIGFTITALNGTSITGVNLNYNGSITADGSTSVTEQVCLSGLSLALCNAKDIKQLLVTNPPPHFSDALFFSPVASITVSKDIQLNGGQHDPAAISQLINTYHTQLPPSSVPEQGSLALIGSGLLLLGWAKQHKRALSSTRN